MGTGTKRKCVPWALWSVLMALVVSRAWATPITKNLATDYGVTPASSASAIADALQHAVLDVEANTDGGTVVIPAYPDAWYYNHPIFIGQGNVTIMGQGQGTKLGITNDCTAPLCLGVKSGINYAGRTDTYGTGQTITPSHFPQISGVTPMVLDASVTGKYGLATYDGTTRAAGYFPPGNLALGKWGSTITELTYDTKNGNAPVQTTDIHTYWYYQPVTTIDLCLWKRDTGTLSGVICGAGGGPNGNITDPRTIWTFETDASNRLCFKFKTVTKGAYDAGNTNNPAETTRTLLLTSGAVTGQGVLRISVQIDFQNPDQTTASTAKCRAWYSFTPQGNTTVTNPTMSDKQDFSGNLRFKKFEYGAFRLGAVTQQPFSGTPAAGQDWVYCGLSMAAGAIWSTAGGDDALNAAQKKLSDGTVANDAYRYFTTASGRPGTYTALKLNQPPSTSSYSSLHAVQELVDGAQSSVGGFWLPSRSLTPLSATAPITLKDLFFQSPSGNTTPIIVGEAGRVNMRNVNISYCVVQGISSLNCNPTNAVLDLEAVATGWAAYDTGVYARGCKVLAQGCGHAGIMTGMRLVGCTGFVDNVCTGAVQREYNIKLYADPSLPGGPMRFSVFQGDNESNWWEYPARGFFYVEAASGLVLTITANCPNVYGMADFATYVELCDPPGGATGPGVLNLSSMGSNSGNQAESIVRCHSNNWYGRIDGFRAAQAQIGGTGIYYRYGPIKVDTGVTCHVKTVDLSTNTPPAFGNWVNGCHSILVPDATSVVGGYSEYRYENGAWAYYNPVQ